MNRITADSRVCKTFNRVTAKKNHSGNGNFWNKIKPFNCVLIQKKKIGNFVGQNVKKIRGGRANFKTIIQHIALYSTKGTRQTKIPTAGHFKSPSTKKEMRNSIANLGSTSRPGLIQISPFVF